jgi:hypothetical protein
MLCRLDSSDSGWRSVADPHEFIPAFRGWWIFVLQNFANFLVCSAALNFLKEGGSSFDYILRPVVISKQQRHPTKSKMWSHYWTPPLSLSLPSPTFPEEDPITYTPLVSLPATQTDHDVTFPLRTLEEKQLTYVHLPRVYFLMKGACAPFIQHPEKVSVVRAGLKITVSRVNKTHVVTHNSPPADQFWITGVFTHTTIK